MAKNNELFKYYTLYISLNLIAYAGIPSPLFGR